MLNVEPKQIIIEPTARCNLKCKYCPQVMEGTHERDMTYDEFEQIVDKIDTDSVIIPWMNGEPLLHPDYDRFVQLLVDRGLRFYVTTNGMVYRKDVYELLSGDNSCYQVIFSLDGIPHSCSKSIEIARPGSRRNVILENIKRFISMRHESMDVGMKICKRGQDYQEIEEYVMYLLTKGVDGSGEYCPDFVIVGERLGQENEVPMRIYPCQYFDNNFLVIRSTGRMVACAYHDKIVNNVEHSMGNIFDYDTISGAYNNYAYQTMRKQHREGNFYPPCDMCSFAYTGTGFKGTVSHRSIPGLLLHYHQDYYNQFFSLKDKQKPNSYYGHKE